MRHVIMSKLPAVIKNAMCVCLYIYIHIYIYMKVTSDAAGDVLCVQLRLADVDLLEPAT